MKNLNQSILIILITLTAISCSVQKSSITGTWISTSISNPAPFFKKTLPDTRAGVVTFTVDSNGTFTWQHKEEKNIIKGKYTLSGDQLTLNVINEKPVKLKLLIDAEKISILTDDGFTFSFRRSFK